MKNHSKDGTPTTFHSLRISPRLTLNRAHALTYAAAIAALIYHRILSLLRSATPLSFALFLSVLIAELVLAFMWVVTQAVRWRPVRRKEYPERLGQAVDDNDLPAIDVFICTADPYKEPPISVVNTALSVMAFDYPSEKLSIYVSDDGGSELTLFALMEAARFARHWLPFCRQNELQDRCPEAYFKSSEGESSQKIKMIYEAMKEKIESVVERGHVSHDLIISKEEHEIFKKWKGFTRRDHPSVVEVLLDSSKYLDVMNSKLPDLVYVSREKRTTSHHHFKAGAQNALIRVSSVMTDAPVILTLDCDMYSNDPQAPRRALCYFLDNGMAPNLAYVQFPQRYPGVNKNDIYGNDNKRLFQLNPIGADGIQGPHYLGTGCFHARRSFYGTPSSSSSPQPHDRKDCKPGSLLNSEEALEKAHEVAGCTYEDGTKWGSTMGFRYGSLVEDFNTGYHMHCQGWRSVFCDPERPAFYCDFPITLSDALSQNKRWCVGLLEVAFSRYNPIIFGIRRTSLLMGFTYSHNTFWSSWSIPIIIYLLIPQLALTYQVPLFPKVFDPWFYLYAYLCLAAYGQDIVDFVAEKGTIGRWWSDQRMWMIRGVTSYLFSIIEFALNQMGVSAPGFNVTSKVIDHEQNARYEKGMFEFGVALPFFVSLGTAAILSLISFVMGFVGAMRTNGGLEDMFLQLFLSGFVVVNCWPIYEAMIFRQDGGKMPGSVTSISILLAGIFHLIAYFIFTD